MCKVSLLYLSRCDVIDADVQGAIICPPTQPLQSGGRRVMRRPSGRWTYLYWHFEWHPHARQSIHCFITYALHYWPCRKPWFAPKPCASRTSLTAINHRGRQRCSLVIDVIARNSSTSSCDRGTRSSGCGSEVASISMQQRRRISTDRLPRAFHCMLSYRGICSSLADR